MWVDVGSPWPGCRAAWLLQRKRPGTLGGGPSAVAAGGEAALGPQAHPTCTAPYQPCPSQDRRTAGHSLGGIGTPVAECTYSTAEHPEGQSTGVVLYQT